MDRYTEIMLRIEELDAEMDKMVGDAQSDIIMGNGYIENEAEWQAKFQELKTEYDALWREKITGIQEAVSARLSAQALYSEVKKTIETGRFKGQHTRLWNGYFLTTDSKDFIYLGDNSQKKEPLYVGCFLVGKGWNFALDFQNLVNWELTTRDKKAITWAVNQGMDQKRAVEILQKCKNLSEDTNANYKAFVKEVTNESNI